MTALKEEFKKKIDEDYQNRRKKNIKMSKVECEKLILEFDSSFQLAETDSNGKEFNISEIVA